MKTFLVASVVMAAGVCGGMASVAAAEQTVTIAPALRAGDVARSNVLTTMSMDMPETDDGFMKNLMQDTLLTASQDVTWTVRRVEPTYSVINQEFSRTQTASSQSETFMSRMMMLAYEGLTGPLEFRVSASGEVEDVLNGGEAAERAGTMLDKSQPLLRDLMKQTLASGVAEDDEYLDRMLKEAINSPAMREQLATRAIGKPLFAGAWLWGKTLTVGSPVAVPVSQQELLVGQETMGATVNADRMVTLVSASEHDVHITWITNATLKSPERPQSAIDTSTWSEDLRRRHEQSLAWSKALAEPQTFVEKGDLRLDRRTGMPIDGSIVMRGGNRSLTLQTVVIYSPVTNVKSGD